MATTRRNRHLTKMCLVVLVFFCVDWGFYMVVDSSFDAVEMTVAADVVDSSESAMDDARETTSLFALCNSWITPVTVQREAEKADDGASALSLR